MLDISSSDLTATDLLRLGTSFRQAQVLLAGVQLGLFSALEDRPSSLGEIADQLGLKGAMLRDYLDTLVALDVLECVDGRYSNTEVADRHLVAARPAFIGGALAFNGTTLYPVWAGLAEALRTGGAHIAESAGDAESFEGMYQDRDRLCRFLAAMDGYTASVVPAVAARFPWQQYEGFIDIGGARGALTAALLRAHPHLSGGCLDLPPVGPIFAEHVAAQGVAGRARFYGGDFFAMPLPSAPVLIFGHVLHDWQLDKRRLLLEKAFTALPDGGAVLIYDAMIDDARSDPFALLMSLNMALTTGGGEYTAADCEAWLADAGFTICPRITLTATDTLVVGQKAAR